MFQRFLNWGKGGVEDDTEKKSQNDLEERKRRLQRDYDPVKERLAKDPSAARRKEEIESYISALLRHDLAAVVRHYGNGMLSTPFIYIFVVCACIR